MPDVALLDKAKDLDRLLSGSKLLSDDAIACLLKRAPQLRQLIRRIHLIGSQLLAQDLHHVETPPHADEVTARRYWLAALLRLDALATIDHASVAALARGGSYLEIVPCPCGCGDWMRPVLLIDHPSPN
jgi:hypothetical protein